VIRRITLDDLDVYRDVRLRALRDSPDAFGSTYAAEAERPVEQWEARVARAASGDRNVVFLAFDGEECVGLAGAIDDDDGDGADRQLISMWVAPSHRGTSVATELVETVLAWSRAGAARTVELWVTKGNDRAQRLYERMGFAVTGDVQPLPSDPCKDEIRMRAVL
jgi:RimJ/RimL family protein N-acetyltransferase